MNNVVNLDKIRQDKVYESSVRFLKNTSAFYEIDYDFSLDRFRNLHNNLYDIYKYENKIYRYQEDVELFLKMTFFDAINSNKKSIKISDILDGIFICKTNDLEVKKVQIRGKELWKKRI